MKPIAIIAWINLYLILWVDFFAATGIFAHYFPEVKGNWFSTVMMIVLTLLFLVLALGMGAIKDTND